MPARKINTVTDGAPIGPRGRTLLRTVRDHGKPYKLTRNADHDSAGRVIAGGYLQRADHDDTTVYITAKGIAYLDHLARAV